MSSCLYIYVGDEDPGGLLEQLTLPSIGASSDEAVGTLAIEPPWGPLDTEHYVWVEINQLYLSLVDQVTVQLTLPDNWDLGSSEYELSPSPLFDNRWEISLVSGGGVSPRTDQICVTVLGQEAT